ncbi:MAG: hypothetical protein JWM90_1139 [Thermoleophilia bacterium]|nr:hypothetical protein [Thermoleophilia bacterium]
MSTKVAPSKLFANAEHHAGCFWWADLATPDVDAAKRFYGELFGWAYDDQPIDETSYYAMAKLDGLDVAAMSGQRQEMRGMPPIWTTYLTVDDVDTTTARVPQLGGTIVSEPFDVMDVGRMSVIQDASGATVALWQTITHPGAAAISQPGTLTWSEVIARDSAAAERFWTGLMGWTTDKMPMPQGGEYTTFLHDGHPAAGMMAMPADMPAETPSAWMVYFAVADLDASITKVRDLGGTVHIPPTPAGDIGTFSMVEDPQGGMFYLMQPHEWPEPE